MEWANNRKANATPGSPFIETPAVVGAVIDLGHCLSMMERSSIKLLESTHRLVTEVAEKENSTLPENTGGPDQLRRQLDCYVVNALHRVRKTLTNETPFDSVRSLFSEGKPIYEKSGFKQRNHIQICIRNTDCIKGYFHPKDEFLPSR